MLDLWWFEDSDCSTEIHNCLWKKEKKFVIVKREADFTTHAVICWYAVIHECLLICKYFLGLILNFPFPFFCFRVFRNVVCWRANVHIKKKGMSRLFGHLQNSWGGNMLLSASLCLFKPEVSPNLHQYPDFCFFLCLCVICTWLITSHRMHNCTHSHLPPFHVFYS